MNIIILNTLLCTFQITLFIMFFVMLWKINYRLKLIVAKINFDCLTLPVRKTTKKDMATLKSRHVPIPPICSTDYN